MEENTVMITDLLSYIVRNGKKILIIALVCALALGMFQGVKGLSSLKNKTTEDPTEPATAYDDISDVNEAEEEYYRKQRDLNKKLERSLQSLENSEEYLEKSRYMDLNPYELYVSDIYLSVVLSDERVEKQAVDYNEISVNYSSQAVVTAYKACFYGNPLAEILNLADYAALEDQYISELLQVIDESGSMLHIKAFGNTREQAEELSHAAYRVIQDLKETVEASTYRHSVVVISDAVKCEVNQEMYDNQQAQYDKLDSCRDTVLDLKKSISELESPHASTSLSAVAKKAAKYGLLGFAAGFVLGCVYFFFKGLFADIIVSSTHLNRSCKLDVLGSLNGGKCVFEKLADRMLGEKKWTSDAESADYIAEKLASLDKNKPLLLLSAKKNLMENEKINALSARLTGAGFSVLRAEDFDHNSAALKLFRENDQVVLVDSIGSKGMNSVENMAKLGTEDGCVKGIILV